MESGKHAQQDTMLSNALIFNGKGPHKIWQVPEKYANGSMIWNVK